MRLQQSLLEGKRERAMAKRAVLSTKEYARLGQIADDVYASSPRGFTRSQLAKLAAGERRGKSVGTKAGGALGGIAGTIAGLRGRPRHIPLKAAAGLVAGALVGRGTGKALGGSRVRDKEFKRRLRKEFGRKAYSAGVR